MYFGARIVSFLLSLIAWLLLVAAVLVWFVITPNRGFGLGSGFGMMQDNPEAAKAAKEAQRQAEKDAEVQSYLLRGGISLGCVIVALVLLLFCDLVSAIIN